jgi:hypothetical protein
VSGTTVAGLAATGGAVWITSTGVTNTSLRDTEIQISPPEHVELDAKQPHSRNHTHLSADLLYEIYAAGDFEFLLKSTTYAAHVSGVVTPAADAELRVPILYCLSPHTPETARLAVMGDSKPIPVAPGPSFTSSICTRPVRGPHRFPWLYPADKTARNKREKKIFIFAIKTCVVDSSEMVLNYLLLNAIID